MKKPATTKNDYGISFIATLFFVFMAIHALFVFFCNEKSNNYQILERTWGFDHLSYFSVPYALVFYIIGFLLILPLLNLKLSLFIQKTIDAHQPVLVFLRNNKYFLYIIISLVSAILFFLFRVKYDLLGDTLIRANQTLSKHFFFTEYGTMFTLSILCQALKPFGIAARQAFVLHSIVAGSCFIFVSLLIADSLGRTFLQKIAIFLFSTTAGTVQLFFGYTEVYSIPALLSLIYIYCCIQNIKEKVGFFAPFASLIVCIIFHLISLAMIPSFFILIYYKYLSDIPAFKWIKTKLFAILLILFFPLLYIAANIIDYDLMPVLSSSATPQQMTLLSVAHFWEFFNSQLLASGSGIFVFIYFQYKFIKGEKGEKGMDPILSFLTYVAAFQLLLLFAFNAILGSNDWDIYSFPAIAYNLLGMYYLASTHHRRSITVKYVVPILIFLNVMNIVPWILINTTDRSVQRIKETLLTDPGSYWINHPPTMHLSITFDGNGLHEEAFEYYKKFYVENPDDPRAHYNYANALLRRNNRDGAIKIFENLLKIAPYYPGSYQILIAIYERSKQHDKTYMVIKKFFGAYSRNPLPFLERMNKENLMSYLNFLYKVELSKKNYGGVEAIKKVLEATAMHFQTQSE